jgi:DNA-binding SARP family transcriptional activator
MSTLRISLFGHVHIAHDSCSCELEAPPVAKALFAYLLLERHRFQPRHILANLFWGEISEDRARSCLSTALWRLRRVLEPDGIPRGTYLLTNARDEVGFNWASDHWLDVEIFEEQVKPVLARNAHTMTPSEARQLEETLQLHSIELLAGFYDDWALRERERLHQLYLDGLAQLMRYHQAQGDYEQSLAFGQQILHHDPLRESIHRELMRLYWQAGRPTMAVRQYQTCRQILAAELNLAPMEETQALHAQIISTTEQQELSTTTVDNLPDLQQALHQLQQATQEFKKAQQKLEQATQLVGQLTRNQVQGYRIEGATSDE